jgi:NAD(P)H-hydrate epimerase
VLALDTPSGIDATIGTILNPAIKGTSTLTIAHPKEGFQAPGMKEFIGELYLTDISVPPELYSREPLNIMVGN